MIVKCSAQIRELFPSLFCFLYEIGLCEPSICITNVVNTSSLLWHIKFGVDGLSYSPYSDDMYILKDTL